MSTRDLPGRGRGRQVQGILKDTAEDDFEAEKEIRRFNNAVLTRKRKREGNRHRERSVLPPTAEAGGRWRKGEGEASAVTMTQRGGSMQ